MTYKEFKSKCVDYYKSQIDKELSVVVLKKKTTPPMELIVTNEYGTSLIHFTEKKHVISAQMYNAVGYTEMRDGEWF